jgi:membrane protein required for colicin V production
LNALDIGLLLLAGVVLVRSYLRGLVQEVAALGGLVLAVVMGLRFHPEAERYLQSAFGPAPYLGIVGFAILFLATLLVVSLISGQLAKVVTKGPLSGVDRLLGLCFGMAKAGLLGILVVFILTFLAGPQAPLVSGSRLAPYALEAADWTLEQLPKGLSRSLAERRAELLKPRTDKPSAKK